MLYSNISLFLNINIIEIVGILENDKEIKFEQLYKYAIIQNTQENLSRKFDLNQELFKGQN